MAVQGLAQYNLVGNATPQAGSCIQLTAAQPFQMGAMWFAQQVDLRKDLDIRARLYLGSNLGNGADGMAFVLQRQSTTAGSSGEGLGYQGISPSVIVELDTYKNNNLADPDNRHMALMYNGIPNHNNSLTPPVSILDGNWPADNLTFINFRFTYTAATRRIQVYTNCNLRIDYTGDVLNSIFQGQPMVFWGFTAATGGSVNQHQVCDVFNSQITALRRADTLCLNDSMRLRAQNIPNAIYQWSPALELDRTDVPNPMCKATQSRQYVCTITDTCYGLVIKDTIDLFVPAVVPHSSTAPDSTCNTYFLPLSIQPALPGYSYSWQMPDGAIQQGASLLVSRPQSGTYTANAFRGNCRIYSQPHVVAVKPGPDALILGDTLFCGGDTLRWQAAPGAATYTWRNPGAQVVSSTDILTIPQLQPAQAGLYSLATTHTLNNCVGFDTALLLVSPQAIARITEDSVRICQGQTLPLQATASSPFTWSQPQWLVNPGSASAPVLRPGNSGWLALSSSTGPGCTRADSVYIAYLRRPTVDAGPDQTIFEGQTALLQARAQGDSLVFRWASSTGGNLGSGLVLAVQPAATTTYRFTAESAAGCGLASDTVRIKVLPALLVPNAFSPNGDGINDRWIIPNIDRYSRVQMRIYNRNGNLLYAGRPQASGWDGTHQGKPLPTGTYYYLIEASELGRALSGWIQLLK